MATAAEPVSSMLAGHYMLGKSPVGWRAEVFSVKVVGLAVEVLILCGTQSHYANLLFTQTLQLSSYFHPSTLVVLPETWALQQVRPLVLPEPRKQSPQAHNAHRVVLG
jgi:hypothetical protein